MAKKPSKNYKMAKSGIFRRRFGHNSDFFSILCKYNVTFIHPIEKWWDRWISKVILITWYLNFIWNSQKQKSHKLRQIYETQYTGRQIRIFASFQT